MAVIVWDMDFIPNSATLFAYSIASVILFITPGPDMSLFLARTMSSGRAAGTASVLGANAGIVIHTLLVAFGISALVAASYTGFLVLKIVGAGYLLWLAVDAIRHGSSLNVGDVNKKQVSVKSSFLMGLSVNLTNPKVVLFFITFLPQFVNAGDAHVTARLIFLGLYFAVINIPLSVLMIWGAEKLVVWLKSRPKFMRGIDYSFAGIFTLFALKIALTQGRH
jgi:threonine/homoserine/homoserine lactone efflux protein